MVDVIPVSVTFISLVALVAFVRNRMNRAQVSFTQEDFAMPKLDGYMQKGSRVFLTLSENILRKLKIINMQIDRYLTDLLDKIKTKNNQV